MHIGLDMKTRMFAIEENGVPVEPSKFFEWEARDRVGIIVRRPFGAMDASLIIFLLASLFYDSNLKRRRRPMYPDIYLFHAGGPWGLHTPFDFVPDRKEIFVGEDPTELLPQINHIGVTHLLIPDREPSAVKHRFKEPEAAIDRIKQVYAYGPTGAVAEPNVRITSEFEHMAPSIKGVLFPEEYLERAQRLLADGSRTSMVPGLRSFDQDELRIVLPTRLARQYEVSRDDPDRARHESRVRQAESANILIEEYRRVETKIAMNML